MICLNKICVYNEENKCKKDEIIIDWRGNCTQMVNTKFTQETLNYSKLYTRLLLKNEDYIFDDETGEFNHMFDVDNYENSD